jgi:hypothetical protein
MPMTTAIRPRVTAQAAFDILALSAGLIRVLGPSAEIG